MLGEAAMLRILEDPFVQNRQFAINVIACSRAALDVKQPIAAIEKNPGLQHNAQPGIEEMLS